MDLLFSWFTPLQWSFIGLVFTLFVIISLYQLIIYRQPARSKYNALPKEDQLLPSISVVLCVTNEYKVLKRLLPILLQQDYPCYEVVVVNDRSEDNSETLLRSFQEQYPHLQVRTTRTDDRFGRSPSLSLGMAIRAAKYDAILSIEADCLIKDAQWMRTMAAPYGGEIEVVLGYTTHYRCSLWTRCYYLQQALHFMGRAAIKRPYTGLGSNVLFKKSLFYDHNGFNVRLTREHIPLKVFIGEVVNRKNCAICTHPSGVTHARIKLNRKMRKLRRKMEKRSLSVCPKGSTYPMLFETTLRLIFYVAASLSIILFYKRLDILIFISLLLLLRPLTVLWLYRSVRKIFDDTGLAVPFICWDLLFPFIYLYRFFR